MIELRDVQKHYHMGDNDVAALAGVSLTITAGEYVAIMGPSGSGKSTLLHVLGLLDAPDSGSYRLEGREVAGMRDDDLAALRGDLIGFIFQQFNLLPRISALANTALPLLYSGRKETQGRPKALLERVGLGKRIFHHPNELSGGQQQRVAIARSLMNNPRIILADEPTGNLDSQSTREILDILRQLNEQGITIVIVTHEEDVGAQAGRLIRMRDGVICSDERRSEMPPATASHLPLPANGKRRSALNIFEHVRQGFNALAANKIRTFLSMLGILIGVAAVVAMLALGKGAQRAIEEQLASLGSNLLSLRPGAEHHGGVALESGAVTRLTLDDADLLAQRIPAVKQTSPAIQGRAQVAFGNKNWSTQLLGAGPAYASMRAATPPIGRFFSAEENQKRSRVAVIGKTVVRNLFEDRSPIGEIIKINKISFQVIGLLPERGATGWRDQDDVIIIPVLTAMHRVFGKDYLDSIDIEVSEASAMEATQQSVKDLMLLRHRIPPLRQQDAFEIRNMADIQEALSQTSKTMSMLLALIAAISLLVGGIGIMNIMLVSVTERTREVGLRKAIGARRRDILVQFLVESVVVSSIGGLLGILVGFGLTQAMAIFAGWTTYVSWYSAALAVLFSASVGIIFGIYPARKASFLNPIEALRSE